MIKILILPLILIQILISKDLSYGEFLELAYQNSQNLIMQDAMTKSLKAEGKALNSWDSPYVEITPSFVRNQNSNRFETQAQVLLMITPKMPWVSGIIKESYDTKIIKNTKVVQLQKNIIAIGAKKSYLLYLIYKEQYEIYKDKEQLAKDALGIAQKRFDANRISKAELLRFKSDYSNALSLLKSQSLLVDMQLKNLQVLVGDSSFSNIIDLDFYYLSQMDLENDINNSIYNDILKLDALDYEKSAKVMSRSRMNDLQIGAGYTFGQNSIDLKLIIPLPFTSKANYEQTALLELQSASLRQYEITKQKIKQSAISYQSQIKEQEELIELSKQNEQNNSALFEIMQKGFDAGVIGVFEYLNTKNNYLDSRIKTTQEKLNYINLLSLLEESLGKEVVEIK